MPVKVVWNFISKIVIVIDTVLHPGQLMEVAFKSAIIKVTVIAKQSLSYSVLRTFFRL